MDHLRRVVVILSLCTGSLAGFSMGADAKKPLTTKSASKTPAAEPLKQSSQNQPEEPAADAALLDSPSEKPEWLDDYVDAMDRAKAEGKLMLIHFYRSSDQRRKEAGQAADSVANIERAFSSPAIGEKLGDFVLVKLPIDTAISVQRKPLKVLDHAAFSELHKGPGIAVIDFAHKNSEYFGYVVSVLPFTPGKYYRFQTSHLTALVNLPEGTLTQRSMILAVRIHPEHPASTVVPKTPFCFRKPRAIPIIRPKFMLLGHQGWGSRFQRIIGKLLGAARPRAGGSSRRKLAEPGFDGLVRRLRGQLAAIGRALECREGAASQLRL